MCLCGFNFFVWTYAHTLAIDNKNSTLNFETYYIYLTCNNKLQITIFVSLNSKAHGNSIDSIMEFLQEVCC